MKKNITKRFIALTLALLSCFALMPATAAERVVDVRVNGYLVDFPDQQPYVNSDGRTLIPVRFVAEELGATVYWDKALKGAVIEKDGMKIEIPIGKAEMKVTKNGKSETVVMDTKAVLKKGRTFVPIRFVAEAMGCYVDFSSAYQTVQIYKDVLTPAEIKEIRSIDPGKWCDAKMNLKNSSTPWANINEHAFQPNDDFWSPEQIYIDYIDSTSGARWNNKTGNSQTLANFVVTRAQSAGTLFYSEMYGVDAVFRTDASAITTDPALDTTHPFIIYGYLTVTFEKGADIAGYKKLNRMAGQAMGNVQPGKSYTYLIEVHYHTPPTGFRFPVCTGVWNRTNGVRVQMY